MFEFLFKYPEQAFLDSQLIFASDLPTTLLPWVLVASTGVVILLVSASLVLNKRSIATWKLSILGLLQILLLSLTIFLFIRPALLSERLVQGLNAVAILLDASESMLLPHSADSASSGTRMQIAQDLLSSSNLAKLESSYRLLPFSFAEQLNSLENFSQLPEPVAATAIAPNLLSALKEASSTSLGAVILVSDGADNEGTLDIDLLSEIQTYRVPVHTIGIGQRSLPNDLQLESVDLPSRALAGSTLNALVTIRHDAAASTRIKVYDGEKFLSSTSIELPPGTTYSQFQIPVSVDTTGQMDLRFTLDPLNNESELSNNSLSIVVDVPDGKYRLLYVEGEPRWEYKFLQRALNEDPGLQLTTILQVTPNKYYRQGISAAEELAKGFPTSADELFKFDALLLGSLSVAEFSDEQQQLIHDFVSERGGTLLMLAGRTGLGLGGWSESIVGEMLPASLSLEDAAFTRKQVPVELTAAGRRAPFLQLTESASDNLAAWESLVDLADYQQLGPLRPAATTLLSIRVDERLQPLLVSQPYGLGHTYLLATSGTWRWQMSMPLEDQSHETFWRQLARQLVAASPRPFELTAIKNGQQVDVRAELRDTTASASDDLSITTVVSSDNGQLLNLTMNPSVSQPGVFIGSFPAQTAGLYTLEAISLRGDNPLETVSTALRIEPGNEGRNLRLNQELLEQLSLATGGRYWDVEEFDQLIDAITYSQAGITEQQIRDLWDAPIFYLLFISIAALQWLLRRRWGLI
jgi:uncharacterized membrane protein